MASGGRAATGAADVAAAGTARVAPLATSEPGAGFEATPTRYQLDAGARRLSGTLLVGGEPSRLVRLSPVGETVLDEILSTGELRGDPASRLADRLVDAGILHPLPGPRPDLVGQTTVVIPVLDDAAGLRHVLCNLSSGAMPAAIVVVDDGSAHESASRIEAVASCAGASLIRREKTGGPAVARDEGLGAVETPFVAFLDADTEPRGRWLEILLGQFFDPAVAAAAPRVRAAPRTRATPDLKDMSPGAQSTRSPTVQRTVQALRAMRASWILSYEHACSPLDLRGAPGLVGTRRRIRYVPGAAVVARTEVLRSVGGFDRSLFRGEDVDLWWRLESKGWRVRFDPRAEVGHAVRPTATALARQRYGYGSSAGALAVAHPGALSSFEAPVWSTSFVVALCALATSRLGMRARSLAAAATALVTLWPAVRLARNLHRLGVPGEGLVALRMVSTSHLKSAFGFRRALRRGWWPAPVALAVASLAFRRRKLCSRAGVPARPKRIVTRRDAAVALLLALPPASAAASLCPIVPGSALGLLDDLSYGAGVLAGAVRAGTLQPLAWRLVPKSPRHVRALRDGSPADPAGSAGSITR